MLSRLLSLSMLLCIGTGTLKAQNARPDNEGAYNFKVWEDTEGCYANTNPDNTADLIRANDWTGRVYINIGLSGSKQRHKVVLRLTFISTERSSLVEVNNRITTGSTMPVEVAFDNGERLLFATADMNDQRREQYRNSSTVSSIGMNLDLAKATSNMRDLTKMTDEQRNGYVCELLQDYDMLGVTISDYAIYFTIKTAPTLQKMAETLAEKTKKKNDYKCTTPPPGIDFRDFPDTETDNPDDILLAPAGYPRQQYNSLSTTNYLRYLYSNCRNWYNKVKVKLQQYQQLQFEDMVQISDKERLNFSFCGLPIGTMTVYFRDEKPKYWSYGLFCNQNQNAADFVVLLSDVIAEKAGTKAQTTAPGRRAERKIDYKGMNVRVKPGANYVIITVIPPKATSAPSVTNPATIPTPATASAINNTVSQPVAVAIPTLTGSNMVEKVMGLVSNPSVKTKQVDVLSTLRSHYPQSSFGVNETGKFSYITFKNFNLQWKGHQVRPSISFEKEKLMYYEYAMDFPRDKFTQQQVIELAQQLKGEIETEMPDIHLKDLESQFLTGNILYSTFCRDPQNKKQSISVFVYTNDNEPYSIVLDVWPTSE